MTLSRPSGVGEDAGTGDDSEASRRPPPPGQSSSYYALMNDDDENDIVTHSESGRGVRLLFSKSKVRSGTLPSC